MRVSPVARGKRPSYPTRATANQHPELLRLLPRRWRANPAVLAALGGACVLLQGCRYRGGLGTGREHATLVAPIFVHGEGRGGFGCIAINPPVFLSEEEAREVIRQECKGAGIALEAPGIATPTVTMPTWPTERDPSLVSKILNRGVTQEPIRWDMSDGSRRVHVQFVSCENADRWSAPPGISVWTSDTAGRARELARRARGSAPTGAYGVFYDPLVYPKEPDYSLGRKDRQATMAAADTEAAQQARRQLRAQVKDFLNWLKGQGVI